MAETEGTGWQRWKVPDGWWRKGPDGRGSRRDGMAEAEGGREKGNAADVSWLKGMRQMQKRRREGKGLQKRRREGNGHPQTGMA
jgi:hypothetical protein